MAEWLYEEGIGENRAVLVDDGRIVEAQIERDNPWPRRGAVHRARFRAPLVDRRNALINLEDGGEAMLQPLPKGVGPGSRFTVEITREEVLGPNRAGKRMTARIVPDETPLGAGPTLLERIKDTAFPVRTLRAIDPDDLEAAGWSELLEEAATGRATFPGGSLWIETPQAMTLIDVDGIMGPADLAVEGARAAARTIRRMGLAGSIGIDLPSARDAAVRKRAAQALDAEMTAPFERTAVNGFGFMQIVIPLHRPSLIDLMQGEPGNAAALALYRRAERDASTWPILIEANREVMGSFACNARNDAELARRRGASVSWRLKPGLPIWGGHVHALAPDDDEA